MVQMAGTLGSTGGSRAGPVHGFASMQQPESRHHKIRRDFSPHSRYLCGICGTSRSCADCQHQFGSANQPRRAPSPSPSPAVRGASPIHTRAPSETPARHISFHSPGRRTQAASDTIAGGGGYNISRSSNTNNNSLGAASSLEAFNSFCSREGPRSGDGGRMDIDGFTGVLARTGAIPEVASLAQARLAFQAASPRGSATIDYPQFASAVESIGSSLDASFGGGLHGANAATTRGRSMQPRDQVFGATSNSEQMSVLMTPYQPRTRNFRSASPPGNRGGARVREMSLSESMAVYQKQDHLGPTLAPRRFQGSTVASRLRQAFTDQQSYRSLYEELLEENRTLVDRLNMAESRLGSSGTLRSGQNASSLGVAHQDAASLAGGMSMVMQGQGQMGTAQRGDQEGLVAEIEELQRERGAMLASIAQKEAQRDEAMRERDGAMRERDAAVREKDSAARERDGALGRLGHAEYEARELRKSYEGLKAIGEDGPALRGELATSMRREELLAKALGHARECVVLRLAEVRCASWASRTCKNGTGAGPRLRREGGEGVYRAVRAWRDQARRIAGVRELRGRAGRHGMLRGGVKGWRAGVWRNQSVRELAGRVFVGLKFACFRSWAACSMWKAKARSKGIRVALSSIRRILSRAFWSWRRSARRDVERESPALLDKPGGRVLEVWGRALRGRIAWREGVVRAWKGWAGSVRDSREVRIHASLLIATSDKALARAHLQSWCFTVCAVKRNNRGMSRAILRTFMHSWYDVRRGGSARDHGVVDYAQAKVGELLIGTGTAGGGSGSGSGSGSEADADERGGGGGGGGEGEGGGGRTASGEEEGCADDGQEDGDGSVHGDDRVGSPHPRPFDVAGEAINAWSKSPSTGARLAGVEPASSRSSSTCGARLASVGLASLRSGGSAQSGDEVGLGVRDDGEYDESVSGAGGEEERGGSGRMSDKRGGDGKGKETEIDQRRIETEIASRVETEIASRVETEIASRVDGQIDRYFRRSAALLSRRAARARLVSCFWEWRGQCTSEEGRIGAAGMAVAGKAAAAKAEKDAKRRLLAAWREQAGLRRWWRLVGGGTALFSGRFKDGSLRQKSSVRDAEDLKWWRVISFSGPRGAAMATIYEWKRVVEASHQADVMSLRMWRLRRRRRALAVIRLWRRVLPQIASNRLSPSPFRRSPLWEPVADSRWRCINTLEGPLEGPVISSNASPSRRTPSPSRTAPQAGRASMSPPWKLSMSERPASPPWRPPGSPRATTVGKPRWRTPSPQRGRSPLRLLRGESPLRPMILPPQSTGRISTLPEGARLAPREDIIQPKGVHLPVPRSMGRISPSPSRDASAIVAALLSGSTPQEILGISRGKKAIPEIEHESSGRVASVLFSPEIATEGGGVEPAVSSSQTLAMLEVLAALDDENLDPNERDMGVADNHGGAGGLSEAYEGSSGGVTPVEDAPPALNLQDEADEELLLKLLSEERFTGGGQEDGDDAVLRILGERGLWNLERSKGDLREPSP